MDGMDKWRHTVEGKLRESRAFLPADERQYAPRRDPSGGVHRHHSENASPKVWSEEYNASKRKKRRNSAWHSDTEEEDSPRVYSHHRHAHKTVFHAPASSPHSDIALTQMFNKWKNQIESEMDERLNKRMRMMEQQMAHRMEHFVNQLMRDRVKQECHNAMREQLQEEHSFNARLAQGNRNASTPYFANPPRGVGTQQSGTFSFVSSTGDSPSKQLNHSATSTAPSMDEVMHKLRQMKKKYRKWRETSVVEIKSLRESVKEYKQIVQHKGSASNQDSLSGQNSSLVHQRLNSLESKIDLLQSESDLKYEQKNAHLDAKFNALEQNFSNMVQERLEKATTTSTTVQHPVAVVTPSHVDSSIFMEMSNKIEDRLQRQLQLSLTQTNDHLMQLYREQEADTKLAIKQLIEKNKEFLVRTAAALKKRTLRGSRRREKISNDDHRKRRSKSTPGRKDHHRTEDKDSLGNVARSDDAHSGQQHVVRDIESVDSSWS